MSDPGRILIADDEETFLHSTARLLQKEGYECECALNVAIAEQMLKKSDFDLLIADIKMPGNSKLELIRNLPRISEGLPVILITGYPSLDSAIQAVELPVVAYLVKPLDFDKLLIHIKKAVDYFRDFCNISKTRQSFQDWAVDLKNIEQLLMSKYHIKASPVYSDAFASIAFRNIVNNLENLRYLMDKYIKHNAELDVCKLFNCPRLTVLEKTLIETINVLDKTRGAFKSKELGELRKKLLTIVSDMKQQT